MLMVLQQAVERGAGKGGGTGVLFVLSNHGLAAAGIAGEGETVEQGVRGQQTHLDQGGGDADKSGGLATGICYPLCGPDGVFLG